MSMVEMEKKKENMKKMVKIKEIYLRMRRKWEKVFNWIIKLIINKLMMKKGEWGGVKKK
jgi:hypothetical protein